MEIILPQFDIEKAISSQWNATIAKSTIIEDDRETALNTALNALISQFKKEIDTYLDSNIQSALDLKVVEPQQLNIFTVYAILKYGETEIRLWRDKQNWTIESSVGIGITTAGDLLQKTLLFELGRLKNETQSG